MKRGQRVMEKEKGKVTRRRRKITLTTEKEIRFQPKHGLLWKEKARKNSKNSYRKRAERRAGKSSKSTGVQGIDRKTRTKRRTQVG